MTIILIIQAFMMATILIIITALIIMIITMATILISRETIQII